MIYLHPLFMVAAVALWLYVLSSGLKRLQSAHFGRKVLFPWKRHVAFGKWAMAGMFIGWGLGLVSTSLASAAPEETGVHMPIGAAIVTLAAVGLVAGLKLNKNRGANNRLRLVHGLCNIFVSVLALGQIYTGMSVLP
ncbi:hypothetical protein JCM15519_00960 [Fundidesulfovibrio butyratiphilus]